MYGRQFDYPSFHCRGEFFDALQQLFQVNATPIRLFAAPMFWKGHRHSKYHHEWIPRGAQGLSFLGGSHTLWALSALFMEKSLVGLTVITTTLTGLTRHYPAGRDHAKDVGYNGSWRKPIPELSAAFPCNRFKVEICCLSLTLLKIVQTCDPEPSLRPSPTELLPRLDDLKTSKKPKLLRQPIWQIQTTAFDRICHRILGAYGLDYRSPI
ncbi:hypothetical protein DFH07DRAFT_780915 [Mycena maculata]|uniref:Uncharacterized protein n=1 Tax=Mycena maculata TaxID=230809 RepID=A0AAD7MVI4_9AGAR|nr:hypothetical protein DFH07DRAFT_780915 [Mycena maculata]